MEREFSCIKVNMLRTEYLEVIVLLSHLFDVSAFLDEGLQ
jgi:hypothetical protein